MKTRRMSAAYHRNHPRATARALLPVLALALAACDGSTGTGPGESAVWDLEVSLNTIRVFDNCEDAADNPGEWSWQARVQVGSRNPAASAGTADYPSSGSVLSWADGALYEPRETLVLRSIAGAQRDSVTITLAATEWDFDTDPPTMDPDMRDARQTNRLERGGAVGLTTGPRCAIRLGYTFDWIER